MLKVITVITIVISLSAGCSRDLTQQYYEKGIGFLERGDVTGAIIAFKKAIENDRNFFEARYQLGLAYIAHGKYESAEKELLKVIKLNPSYHKTHIALAKAYTGLSRIDDAVKEINLYLSKIIDNAEAYEVAASVYAVKKDYPKAEEYLDRAMKISPGRISSKIILSDIYLADGKIPQAEKLIKEVLESDGKNRKALDINARIRRVHGRTGETVSAYQ